MVAEQVEVEVSVEEVVVVAGWGAIGLELAPVGSVFALIVERGYHMKRELPATT